MKSYLTAGEQSDQICLLTCGRATPLEPACNDSSAGSGEQVSVYFGCGCFWHVQHEFVVTEMGKLCRKDESITARTAYAGSKKVGSRDLVCYHNSQGTADYGELGHAEVVEMTVPKDKFSEFADTFWRVCVNGDREDVQDTGGEYRSLVGLPGGVNSPLMSELEKRAGSVHLVAGKGSEPDTLGTGVVIVYDTADFPAHTAEKYHQFHDDMMDQYGAEYNNLRQYASQTGCPEAGPFFQFS